VAVVLLPSLPSVADGASVSNSVVVFPAETRVFVGMGTKDDALPVAFPDAVDVTFLLLSRTIRESSSGSHRGQGHAVVNVERKRNIIEYNWRFCEVRIVEIRMLIPFNRRFSPNAPEKPFNIQIMYIYVGKLVR